VRGRKRHLLVDTEGLVLKEKVHSAKGPDQDGLRLLLPVVEEPPLDPPKMVSAPLTPLRESELSPLKMVSRPLPPFTDCHAAEVSLRSAVPR